MEARRIHLPPREAAPRAAKVTLTPKDLARVAEAQRVQAAKGARRQAQYDAGQRGYYYA